MFLQYFSSFTLFSPTKQGYGGNGLEINNFSFQPAGNGGQRGTLRNHQGDSWMGFIRGNHILDSEPWGGAFGGPHVQREFSFPGSQVGVNGGNGHFQPRNKFMRFKFRSIAFSFVHFQPFSFPFFQVFFLFLYSIVLSCPFILPSEYFMVS